MIDCPPLFLRVPYRAPFEDGPLAAKFRDDAIEYLYGHPKRRGPIDLATLRSTVQRELADLLGVRRKSGRRKTVAYAAAVGDFELRIEVELDRAGFSFRYAHDVRRGQAVVFTGESILSLWGIMGETGWRCVTDDDVKPAVASLCRCVALVRDARPWE